VAGKILVDSSKVLDTVAGSVIQQKSR